MRARPASATWLKLVTSPATIQRKPTVSSPSDAHEREADAVADRVMRSPDPGAEAAGPATTGPVPALQARGEARSGERGAMDAGPALRVASRGGEPLPAGARSFFEPRLGQDLGGVRVHTGQEAAHAARSIGAQAFTAGEHVVFGEGRFSPETTAGKHLLAHELAHVLQQRSGEIDHVQREAAPDPTERVGTSLWPKDAEGKDLPPSIDDISQGGLKDCYLFAAMAAIVSTSPEKIKNMIKDNNNGTYTVTFSGIGVFSSATQTVTADFVVGKHGDVKSRGAFWPLIIEKAYAQQKGGLDKIGGDKGGNAGTAVDDLINVGPSRFDPRDKTADYIMGRFQKAKDNKWPAMLLSPKRDGAGDEKKAIADGGSGLRFWHWYVVTDVDGEKNKLKLFNPWGDRHPNGDGWVDVDTVRKFFIEADIHD